MTLNLFVSNELVINHIIIELRILLTSTSEVYGDPLVHPQDESYWGNVNPIGMWNILKLMSNDKDLAI